MKRNLSGISYSSEAEEVFAAKEWGVPIDEWPWKPRWAKATMIAACRSLSIIAYYAYHPEE